MIELRERFGKWINGNYPYVSVWIGPLILIGSLLLQGKVIFWGTTYLQFLPWRLIGWEQIVNGHFPLWNSFNGYGTPLMANYQTAFFYPPNFIIWIAAFIAGIKGIAVAQTLLVLGHLVVAGYGMIFLTKDLGLSKLGQSVAAIAFSMSGYLVSRASFLSMNAVLAWLPWILFYHLRIANFSTWIHILKSKDVLFAILFNTLLLLSGHAQLAWYTILLSFFWLMIWNWYYHRFSRIILSVGIFAVILFIAVGISAVQLVPTAEFLLQSQRSNQVEFTYALNYSLWPWRLLTLFSPNLFGNPAQGDYWVKADNFWEDNIYTGILTIIFALISCGRLVCGRFSKNRKTTLFISFSLVTIGIALVLALGKNTPIFPFLYRYVPTFNMFQAPSRFSIWIVAMVSILAGISIDNWIKPSGKWLYWSRLLSAGAFGISATSVVVWLFFKDRFQSTYITGISETGALLLVLLLINLFAPREKEDPSKATPLMTFFILALVICDLTFANWGVNPGLSANNFDKFTFTSNSRIDPDAQSLVFIDPKSEENVKFSKFFRFDTFYPAIGWDALTNYFIPNSNIYEHVSSVNNFDPLVTERYDRWSSIVFPEITNQESEFNMFWSIGKVISENSEPPGLLPSGKDVQSRFRWFGCAVTVKDLDGAAQRLTEQIKSGTFLNTIVIEGITSKNPVCLQQNSEMKVVVAQSTRSYSKYFISTDHDGWLMQLASNYPGWEARIDGKIVPLYYGDILFRTIYLPAGEHTIEYSYQSVSFRVGFIISTGFIIVLIFYLFVRRKINE